MTHIKKLTLNFSIVMLLTFLFACGQENINKNLLQADNPKDSIQTFTIDTFSNIPPEIDGCSCAYSNDSIEYDSRKFIFINGYADTSFLKISGALTKFKLTDVIGIDSENETAKYTNENYNMTIEMKDGKKTGDESESRTGTIKLVNKKGKTLIRKYYGECGC